MDGSSGQIRRARAGMTLVELLLALALLVAVAGLALPNMFAILARSTAEEGRRQALAALAGARAEAIGAGEPVRVVAEPQADGGGWRLRAGRLALEVDGVDGGGGALGGGGAGGDAEGWKPETVAALPAGWIVLAADRAGESMGALGSGGERIEAAGPVELVTFLPDGGAISPAGGARFAAGARQFALKVNRWSGRATLELQAGGAPGAEPEDDEDDEVDERSGDGGEFDAWDAGEGGAQW